jgi:hypothetical protein
MCSLTAKKLIKVITLNSSEVFQCVTKATTGTGSKPARGTPFASWLQQIHVHIALQLKSSDFTMLLILKNKNR